MRNVARCSGVERPLGSSCLPVSLELLVYVDRATFVFWRTGRIALRRTLVGASGMAYAENALACKVPRVPDGSGGRDSSDAAITDRLRRAPPSPSALVGVVPRNPPHWARADRVTGHRWRRS